MDCSAAHPDAKPEANALEHALRHGLGRRVGGVAARQLRRVVAAESQSAELRQRFACSTHSCTCASCAGGGFETSSLCRELAKTSSCAAVARNRRGKAANDGRVKQWLLHALGIRYNWSI